MAAGRLSPSHRAVGEYTFRFQARSAGGQNGGPRGGMDAGTRRQLAGVIVWGLRKFEFGVRRALAGMDAAPRVGDEGAVPPAYRKLVAEYYRALAERRARPS